MRLAFSNKLKDDVSSSVLKAIAATGIVNIPVVAEVVRARNEIENVALEDVELLVLELAQRCGAACELDRGQTALYGSLARFH